MGPALPPTWRQQRGDRAEALAWEALAGRGYRPFRRKVRAGGGELDILAWDQDTLVFVEVRSRQSDRFGSPEATINAAKRARLQRAAQAVLRGWPPPWPAQIRFDVVSVVFGPPLRLQVLPAAWVIDG